MTRMKASIVALILALALSVSVALYKPQDHEKVSESPTEPQAQYTITDAINEQLTHKSVEPIEVAPVVPPKVAEVKPHPKAESKPKSKSIAVQATFYTAYCDGCSGITATGDNVRNTIYANGYRVIAVDPRVIPLRSIVRVTLADGTTFDAIASDKGGAIKGAKIDVLVASKSEAYRLGRQQAKVTILND